MFRQSDIRDEIRHQPCEECGLPLSEQEDYILSFYKGRYIQLHKGCSAFIDRGGPKKEGGPLGALLDEPFCPKA